MSRSKRKSSSRRKAVAADTPVAASASRHETAPNVSENTPSAASPSPDTLPLPGETPDSSSARERTRNGVSGLTCALCCGICLLGGILLGNHMPHVLDSRAGKAPAEQPAPAEPSASAPTDAVAEAKPADSAAAVTPVSATPAGESSFAASPVPPGAGEAPARQKSMDGKRQEEIRHLEKFLADNPQDAARWTELGNIYFDTHPLKAIAAYERSLALRPDNPDVLTDLGIMYRATGRLDRALDCFEQAMRIHPSHEPSRFNKGFVLLFDLHRNAEAKAVWQELLRKNPRATAPDGTGMHVLIEQCDRPLP